MALAGWQGRAAEATELIGVVTRHAMARDEGMGLSLAHYTSAVLHNGLGRYSNALAAADQACANPHELGKRTASARVGLTAQERQIARRDRDGHTNPEIGAELFLSSCTVE